MYLFSFKTVVYVLYSYLLGRMRVGGGISVFFVAVALVSCKEPADVSNNTKVEEPKESIQVKKVESLPDMSVRVFRNGISAINGRYARAYDGALRRDNEFLFGGDTMIDLESKKEIILKWSP